MKHPSIWVIVAVTGLVGLVVPAEQEAGVSDDERMLRVASVKTDAAGLLDFFRKHTITEEQHKDLPGLIRKLGNDSFDVRESASEGLRRLGKLAVPLLTEALKDADPEVVRRAEECLQTIQKGADVALHIAAARLLALKKPTGAVPVLLAYLPSSPDDQATEAVLTCLEAVRLTDGKIDPALPAALADKDPVRRAAAALVLGKTSPEHQPAVRRLLTDADVLVRYHAATALVRAGDKSALDTLVGLFKDCPPDQIWQVEDLLFRLAEDKGPTVTLSSGYDAANRQKCQEAWDKWWKTSRDTVDLARLGQEKAEIGAKLICELQGGAEGGGRVAELGPDDKVRWQFDNVGGPIDAQLLPSGRVLIAEININRVSERDRQGKIHFEKKLEHSPMTAQRLANGNVFIATYHELLEVTPAGQTVYSYRKPDHRIYGAQKLRNGNILYVTATGLIIELDRQGREVRSVPAGDTSNWGSVELLANGHFLVCRCGKHEVVEIDSDGKQLWRCEVQWPTWASQRANGRVLVACAHSGQVVEFDRNGKEVWKQSLNNRPCRVRRY